MWISRNKIHTLEFLLEQRERDVKILSGRVADNENRVWAIANHLNATFTLNPPFTLEKKKQ